jgi:hypothetical protein
LTISHELYQSIQNDVKALFKEKRDLHKSEQIEDERTICLTKSNSANKNCATC